MPLRDAKPLMIRPAGLSDSIDGTNSPPGVMSQLANLIPNPSTKNQYVCRPASVKATSFAGFSTPLQPTALLILGNLAWGMIPSSRNAGKDEPFCYNISTGAFVTIGNVTSANTPTSPATTGDWEPPTISSITNGRIVITHPGYNFAGGQAIGWIDISSFVSNTITGSTHTSTTLDTLSSNVLTVGWQVGMSITGTDIPANTYILSIASNGLSVVLSNAATGTHSGNTYTVSGGTPAAPIYGSGQTSPVNLVGRPVAAAQFNSRAYYAINNSVMYSDTQNPVQITAGTQALILGDSNYVNALSGLPLTSQVTGGSIQSLIAFKGDNEYFQITGDPATSNLALNAVPSTVGTLAPNTICGTPIGLAFIAPDGLRFIQFSGQCTDVIGANGDGVNVPFLYAINPTRMSMAYNQNTLRVTVQNGFLSAQPFQEYWYNLSLKTWSGPHSFPAALIEAYQGTFNGFLSVGVGINAALWTSTANPTNSSTYTENGVALNFTYATVLLPDNQESAMNSVIESTIAMSIPAGANWNVLAADEDNGTLGLLQLTGAGMGSSVWDAFTWGASPWGEANAYFQQIPLHWTQPLVFKQMTLTVNGAAQNGIVLGNVYVKYQVLGYNYAPPL